MFQRETHRKREKAAFNGSSTGEDEMPFLCALKDGQKGGRQVEEERTREQERKKNNGEERGKEETFQPVFSIQRHFDRAEPTLWQGVEPF